MSAVACTCSLCQASWLGGGGENESNQAAGWVPSGLGSYALQDGVVGGLIGQGPIQGHDVSGPPVPAPPPVIPQAQADTSLIRLDQFRADPRFSGIDGRGVSVVVLDTGIDLNHSFFGADANSNGVADRIVYSYDFSGSNDSNASDTHGHGSNVASIIGSQDSTYTGMAPGVNIIALKVFPDGSNPSATNADIAEALNWVVANRAAYNIVAVNMSLGSFSNYNSPTSNPYGSQFATLAANNTAVVVASGNSYASFQTPGVSSPSADPNAWSVGAVWDRNTGFGYQWSGGSIDYTTGADRIISFSQRSPTMTTIFAPGGQITGANYDGGYTTYSGTSQAAPHIAGLVADMQQLALQVSGHFLSVSQLKQEMINGSAVIYDGDDENDNVANTFAYYRRVDAVGWGTQVLNDLFAGTAGNDTLNGTAAGDAIYGGAGADTLSGNGGNDSIFGGIGNDTLAGGAGNDTIDGGADFDTAVFSDLRSSYQVTWDFDFVRVGKSGETDTLTNVEQLNFSDGSVLVSSLAPPGVTIESFGATKLVEIGTRFFLRDASDAGPYLKFQGLPYVDGQSGAWKAIATEKVAGGGYQIAWKNGSADQYQVWNIDANGNYTGTATGILAGLELSFQMIETTFLQDLNGDGTIGPATTTIESSGTTKLDHVANQFFLRDTGGAGPSLKFGGTPFTDGRFGAWTAIGAEKTGTGYEVVIKFGAADQYQVWNLDNAGNFLGAATGAVSGSDMDLQILETSFQQDLNGNGTIGPATTTIESFGVTHLDHVGNQFFLRDSLNAGPSLKFGGTPFTDGRFGAWTAIGAEKTGTGYEVAIKNGAADQYQVWNLDNAGNFLGAATGAVSGSDMDLQVLETSFQQDLNGNGTIGPATTTIESYGATKLVQVGNQFFLRDAGGAGPALKYQGTPFTEGRFGEWKPIAAELLGGGFPYQVVMKFGAADQYQVWSLDSNGDFANAGSGTVSGTTLSLEYLETPFQQDLNGDGTVGPTTRTIESFGVTRLVEFGNQYQLINSAASGAYLMYLGAPITEGQFGAWTPIGAEQTANGYVAAFKNGSADQYVVWNLDRNGNYTGSAGGVMAGADPALAAMETIFNQDLNGNSHIGSMTELGVLQIVEAIAAFDPGAAGQATLAVENAETIVPMLATNLNRT